METPETSVLLALVAMPPLVLLIWGLSKIRFTNEWETNWGGHHILARNWYTPLLIVGGEELLIDGVLAPKYKPSRPRMVENLYGEIHQGDEVFKVHVRMSLTILDEYCVVWQCRKGAIRSDLPPKN
jgi:hypothetical protein